MKNLYTKSLSFCAAICLIFFSCQKDISTEPVTPGGADFVTKVNASVSGFVTDQNNLAVQNAMVKVGSSTVTTDEYGFFEVRNVQVVKTAATVTVTMPGYFKGIKTWMAETNKSAFFRIKLIPKTNTGNFTATSGGSVSLTNGLNVSFPANGVMTTAGAIYTGTVNVSSYWINPTSPDLNKIMPGDLRGVDVSGGLKTLTTFGMAAVELTGSAGEALQIATGRKATLTIPVPSSISGTAPATIPLWYFDEVKGVWIEEGQATKTGSNYVGDVAHFSFWNCDVPANYVQFNCTVINASGNPVSGALVKISVVSQPNSAGYGYTDSTGYVGGAVPGNAQLLLEVLGDWGCVNGMYSQTFSTTNVNVSLGNITVAAGNTATVTGNVTSCTASPVINGYIIMNRNGLNFRYNLTAGGAFSFSTPICTSGNNVTFIAEDITALQQSTPMPYTLVTGANALGTLNACGISTQEFINYTLNGTSYSFTTPADSVFMSGQGTLGNFYIAGYGNNKSLNMQIDRTGIGVGTSQALLQFISSPPFTPGVTVSTNGIMVNVTEYGAVGQFLAGNFSGLLTGPTNYTVVCTFRVRRTF